MEPQVDGLVLDPTVRTLRDLVRAREAAQPADTCFTFVANDGARTDWTYAEFGAGVRRVAAGLADLGVGRGDAVIVHLGNRSEFVLSWFALAWLGAIMVPSNVDNTEHELAHLFDLGEAIGLITSPRYLGTLSRVAGRLDRPVFGVVTDKGEAADPTLSRLITFEELAEDSNRPPEVELDETDVCEFLFTSGTTSAPKAVMISHANCIRAGVRKVMSCMFDRNDRFLTALPVFHANAQATTIMVALVAGAPCVIVENYSARRFWQQIREYEATCTSLVAMQVRTLLAQPPAPTDRDHRLRCNFYAINVLDAEMAEFERRFGMRLMNGWGMSETFCAVTRTPLHGDRRWPSVGVPLHDRLIRIVDEAGRDLPVGKIGEILVGGVPGISLMKGYYRDPEATSRTLDHGWLHTGDNGYVDRDGYLYFYDRKKDIIKRAGENVSALEVEGVLLRHDGILEAAVIGIPDSIRDESVKACLVLAPGAELDAEQVRAHCRAFLSEFKVPTVIEFCDALPKTSVGKIEKRRLREESGV